jgi:N-acetylglucosamine-6-phosphate deacetylase
MSDDRRFVDLQVNGYAGVDFNGDDLDAESLHECCERLARDAVAGILATIITDRMDAMVARLARIAVLRQQDSLVEDMIWGLHIEGPFINETPGYVGAHPADAVRPADWDQMQRLLEAGGGLVRIVTLAPERDPALAVTRSLAKEKIVVSAGHCDPTLDQLRAAIDAGLTMFTHLGNGCPMHLHRHDNIIQRVLSVSGQLWISFIGDGVHVDFPALGNYLRCTGTDRAVIVTDAISAAGLGPGRYSIGSQLVQIGEDLVPWAPDRSHFVGSASTMLRMEENLRSRLGLSDDDVRSLMVENPRRVLGTPVQPPCPRRE